ncbi:hypothetical protein BpHYR1_020128 [Brachionus plicatilis]|uniref:Uncharacterized protein n=1 Tax=Brachionus plicatilis TaxID=10195 RepID=A0A3M7RXQ7_BRAPC|nr:hypothetical protein BpHYR1_020128 [Brachionus plicatilis]
MTNKMCTSKSNTYYYTSREDIIEKLDESLKNVKISDVKRQLKNNKSPNAFKPPQKSLEPIFQQDFYETKLYNKIE